MRLKFFCESVTGQQPPSKGGSVTLRPSTVNDPAAPQPMPSMNGSMQILAGDSTDLRAFFVPGQEYFLDISPA